MGQATVVISGAVNTIELRYTPKGTAILDIALAGVGKAEGKEVFHKIYARFFGAYAEELATNVKEGQPVMVTGRFTQERWERDGKKYSRLRFLANSIAALHKSTVRQTDNGPVLENAVNRVVFSGNAVKNAAIHKLKNDLTVAEFDVAVNEGPESTSFFQVKAWNSLAEKLGRLQKGDPVYVQGRYRLESWTTEDGERAYRDVIIANEVFTGSRIRIELPDKTAAAPAPKAEEAASDPLEEEAFEDLPF